MDPIKELCQAMAANPHVMTFSDIAKAAGKGAAVVQKSSQPYAPLFGAILGVSLEASNRALLMSKELLEELGSEEQTEKKTKKKASLR